MSVIKNPLTLILLFVLGLGVIDRLGGQEKSTAPTNKTAAKADAKTVAKADAKKDAPTAEKPAEEKKDTQNPDSIATIEPPKVKMSSPKPQGIGPHDWGQ